MVITEDGSVLYSDSIFDYSVGESVKVEEVLQKDQSFGKGTEGYEKEFLVLTDGNQTKGFAIFAVKDSFYQNSNRLKKAVYLFLPIGISILFVMILAFIKSCYLQIRILNPVSEISSSAKEIITGNYDLEVVRDYGSKIAENEMGDLSYSFELMRDELKSKQMREEELKRSQQELISCISHDLRTPISTIKAYGEGLRDGIANTDKKKEEYIKIIIDKTNLLIEMIKELLDISNAQLKKLEIQKQEVYFTKYFEEVMREIQIFARQRSADLVWDNQAADMIVMIDSKRITEVLYNLVENSLKYVKEDPLRIEIIAINMKKGIQIAVKDNGIGIEVDDIPYVFDKFYRAEKSRTSSIPGSGLGLSICKYIIEAHGGTIECKSRKSVGCEIIFTIT
ncbi:MAG: HAMP domain-containing sensor histidine kinase [Lachnospiraceae bacterium]|nr:HAMP domain-containing sensor histidine kinase [Lachnospiraceae bacterium]